MLQPSFPEELAEVVEKMPAFPNSVRRILEMTANPDTAPKELIRVIDHDPIMTMKVIKLVNSAYFGLAEPITSIDRAVVYVGFNTIKNLALTIAAIGIMPKVRFSGLDMNQFLLHSLGCAALARKLAEHLRIDPKESTDYFIGGLLHDFGKIVLAIWQPEGFERAIQESRETSLPLFMTETNQLGIDHAGAGALLGEHWQLPESLIACMRDHHNAVDMDQVSDILACVVAADTLISRKQFGHAGNYAQEGLPETVMARFQCDLETLDDQLGSIQQELERVRALALI